MCSHTETIISSKSFKSSNKRISWKNLKDEDGKYVCPVDGCSYTYNAKKTGMTSAISEHHRRKHKFTKSYACDKCEKVFNSSSELNQHINRKHKICLIECKHEGCSHVDSNSGNVKAHYARKHMSVRPIKEGDMFKCPNCDYKSKSPCFAHIAGCVEGTPYKLIYK